jgi:hypothetical protein
MVRSTLAMTICAHLLMQSGFGSRIGGLLANAYKNL